MSKEYSNRILLRQVYIGNAHSLWNDNEQHCLLKIIILRRFFYAKNKVSRGYFHDYDGVRHGVRDDLLQHCTEHRRDE